MQPPGVLNQGPLPGDGQRQEERIEPRVVEALANVPASGKQEPFLSGRDGRELLTHVAVGLGSHPSPQHDKMPRKRSKLAREVLEVVPALGQQDRGAPTDESSDDVVEDHRVARLVPRQRAIETLDPSVGGSDRRMEAGLAHDERVLERTLARVGLCVHREAYWTKLHLDYRMASIASLRRRGQSHDVTR